MGPNFVVSVESDVVIVRNSLKLYVFFIFQSLAFVPSILDLTLELMDK